MDRYHVYKIPQLIRILNRINLVHTPTPCSFKIQFNIILQLTARRLKLFASFRFSDQNFLSTSHFSHDTCLARLILFELNFIIIFGKGYKL